jgi:adenine-specific DNA-methyltransferase
VKCIYIDPPYNTGSAFEHYDDGVEHSLWLSLMRDRLEILTRLLREDGSIWITLDDNEVHYLKVVLDELLGRPNFIASVCWEKIYTLKNSARHFSAMHDYILVYAKNIEALTINHLTRSEEQNAVFVNPDKDPRGPWVANAVHARNFYSRGSYEVTSPSGQKFAPPPGRYWTVSPERFAELDADKRIWWGPGGKNAPRKKTYVDEVKQSVVPGTIWRHTDVGQNAEAKQEIKQLFADEGGVFITPKPERLLKRVLEIGSSPGDLVLDSFAGTGTTAAVAHKMGRRWIGIELGEHAITHCAPRLRKVIDNQDPGGITETTGWTGGGGFRFFRLAPSLLQQDRWGNWVINKTYRAEMLAEAMCKIEGFRYEPSQAHFWQHGQSTERDFIYVTTQALTHEQLVALADEVGPDRSLLICCTAFRARPEVFSNLTIKKIPAAVLARCEWGRDDYSLNVSHAAPAPATDPEPAAPSAAAPAKAKRGRKPAPATEQPGLPLGEGEEP